MPTFPGQALAAIVAVGGLLALAVQAVASSDDSWDEFRHEVERACLTAVAGTLDHPRIQVDPFGSGSYGLAILTGVEPGGDNVARNVVCVFRKSSGEAEVGSAMDVGHQ
jgi:hypothetical protein